MSSKYEIWLTYNGESEKVHFPVNPEKFSIKNGSKNETVNISGLGEIIIKQDRPALTLSFSSYLPAAYFPGMNFSYIWNPYVIAEKIMRWKNGDKPCHLIITGTPINIYCTIEDFPLDEMGGDVGTVYYTLKLKEHRNVSVRQIEVVQDQAVITPEETRIDNRVQPSTYTVASGDSLYLIARKVLGDGARWKEIFEINKDQIESYNMIYPGQVFVMPG
ncbi:MAG: LysM peptidoglycan-binding domain-containing protein [Monoglobales bacterium]